MVPEMRDLMALATVRRLLLELGFVLLPEGHDQRIGPLELWIHEPRAELDGRTPLEILATPGGEGVLKTCLVDLIDVANRGW